MSRLPVVRRAAVAGLAAVAVTLAGCSGGEQPTQQSSDTPSPDQPSANARNSGTLVQTSPLTGRKARHGLPDRPIAVVKVDNTDNARPQVGLRQADLVLEEMVEGGLTRLAAFYYSQTPDRVGPVRSMRDTDVGIVKPTGGVLVASGGAQGTVRRLRNAGVTMYSETNGNIGLDVDGSRRAPYNRILDLDAFAKKLSDLKNRAPTRPYLPFGHVRSASKHGQKAPKDLTVTFSPGHQTTWSYEHGTWRRRNGPTPVKDDFHADNLLVLSARVTDAGYLDPAGNPVPDTVFKGQGKAVLFRGRQRVTGTWSKKHLSSRLHLRTGSGKKQLTVPPGHTWIELVPRDGGHVSGG